MEGDGDGRARRVKRTEVRERLVRAAYAVFEERGYEGASLDRVAEAAGFSKGAVYSNFSSKDELLFELVSARIDERIEALGAAAGRAAAAAAARKADGVAAARFAGRLLQGIGEADPGWQTLFIEFWLRCARNEELRAKLAAKRREMRSRIADAVQARAASLGASVTRSRAMDLATAILALSNGLGIEAIADPEAVRPALLGELLARICAPSLEPAAGAAPRKAPKGARKPR